MECSVSDFSSIKKVLEREYNRPLDEIFESIDPVPIGSASLAQVHKGILKDGTPVAIKVQHVYIPYHCPGDILTVKIGCALSEFIFPEFKYKWLGKEFDTNLPKELDFRNEGKNADKLRKLLEKDIRIVIPKVYWEYTTNKILVMSFEEGKPITNMNYIKKNNIKVNEIAHILCDVFNKQIFELGFVHSDPHPGNLFVRKQKENGKEITKLVLLDHGLYRDFDDSFRYNYANLWRGIINQNKDLLKESCNNLGITKVELFMSILTSNTYDTLMDKDNKYLAGKRIGQKSKIITFILETKADQERLKKYAAIYHKDITHVLNDVRREMLLLLKINEFLRNIDRRMGSPMNNFENMVNNLFNI
jgi:aarF domain-containing kinase